MSALDRLISLLGDEVQTEEDETFALFAQDLPSSRNLGMLDAGASQVDVTLSGRDLTIHQSPGVLASNRAGGTTGAIVWRITPILAEWLSSPANPLFVSGLLSARSAVLELGCGVSGLVGLALAPRVRRVVLTDQPYVGRLVEQNVAENIAALLPPLAPAPAPNATRQKRAGGGSGSGLGGTGRPRRPARGRGAGAGGGGGPRPSPRHVNVHFAPLDWETDQVTPHLLLLPAGGMLGGGRSSGARGQNDRLGPDADAGGSFDAVIACDCVYNDALIAPLVTTCADACRLKGSHYYYHHHMQDAKEGPPSSMAAAAHGDADGQGSAESNDGDIDISGGIGGIGDAHENSDSGPWCATTEENSSSALTDAGAAPCVCVVAQQLRHADVFAAWMACFLESFRAWRVPDELLPAGLRASMGFAVHVGVLRRPAR